MGEQTSFDAAMREGERLGYFVETLTLARDGIEYEVPKVFYDDLLATQQDCAQFAGDNERLLKALQVETVEQAIATVSDLTRQLATARAALEFYAALEEYDKGDGGDRAQEALAASAALPDAVR